MAQNSHDRSNSRAMCTVFRNELLIAVELVEVSELLGYDLFSVTHRKHHYHVIGISYLLLIMVHNGQYLMANNCGYR